MKKIHLDNRRLKIAFFGTPELASTVLKALLEANEDDISLVVCQPDKPQGRKKKIIPPPVKVLAQDAGIEVIQPTKMKDGSLANLLRERNFDLAIVIAYGRILTQDTLESIRGGFWNIHTSLLPKYRGASPIHHALLLGEEETGVTLMQMTEGCDEGPILSVARTKVSVTENLLSLSDKLVKLGCELVLDGIRQAKTQGLGVQTQDHSQASHAPLLRKTDGQLDFAKTAVQLERQVRAFNPWPGTFVKLVTGDALKILQTRVKAVESERAVGEIAELSDTIGVQTKEGCLEILRLQPPGKKAMATSDYLRGAGKKWEIGDSFGRPVI